jgi:hypothetical protein
MTAKSLLTDRVDVDANISAAPVPARRSSVGWAIRLLVVMYLRLGPPSRADTKARRGASQTEEAGLGKWTGISNRTAKAY